MGENGAGKSTLIKHLNGLLKPKSGTVIIDGLSTQNTPVSKLSEKVGIVFQYPEFIQSNSPTQRVGGHTQNSFNSILHSFPMLSL